MTTTPPTGAEPATADVLRRGELSVEGRLVVASNLTVLATASLGGVDVHCVYKPIAGERPLWDFPDGTLAAREVAAYTLSDAAGWNLVPHTVLREDGPLGAGMCQEWINEDDDATPWVDVVDPAEVGDGVLAVLEAMDGDGAPVVVVHRDAEELRRLALFDVVVNNADRKGGHILAAPGGTVLGVDHGVTFHTEPKLRTVLWGWAGRPLDDADVSSLEALHAGLKGGPLSGSLGALLDEAEIDAARDRIGALLAAGEFPRPSGRMPVPWPVL